jgi:signal transduction histidine kinase
MSIKLRLALLLGLLLTGLVAATATLGLLERAEKTAVVARERELRAVLLHHALDSASRALPQDAADLALSPEFGQLLRQPDRPDIQANLATSLNRAGMHALWIVEAGGRVRRHARVAGTTGPAELPLPAGEFASLVLARPNPQFFVESDGRLDEIAIRRLANPVDGDWIIVARAWDEPHLRGLAAVTESDVSLRGIEEASEAPHAGSAIVLSRTLADWRDHPLRQLRLEYRATEMEQAAEPDWRLARVFFSFGLLLLVAVWLAIQAWVTRPLARIRESLATDNPQLVAELSTEKSELGRVAELVRSSFEQRSALQREIRERISAQAAREESEAALRANLEERSKLGRDLHDGVIQSLYAAGMGLSGIRPLLRPEQTEAAARLEQSRAALNETIHDVRNFLIGLEPEALKLQTFSQAVAALLDLMNGIRPCHSRVEIDETLASRLTLAQRVHALQIAREAISNALRHGEASQITLALRSRAGQAEFEVTDDGRGFDPNSAASPGKGLLNFAQRARELGADLSVESQPGQGTRVRLIFSLSRP